MGARHSCKTRIIELPSDVVGLVLKRLDFKDLCNVRSASKRFYNVCEKHNLFEHALVRQFGFEMVSSQEECKSCNRTISGKSVCLGCAKKVRKLEKVVISSRSRHERSWSHDYICGCHSESYIVVKGSAKYCEGSITECWYHLHKDKLSHCNG